MLVDKTDSMPTNHLKMTWKETFAGGIGLYSTFGKLFKEHEEDQSRPLSETLLEHKKNITELDDMFIKIRHEIIENGDTDTSPSLAEIKKAYTTFFSQAGLTGLFMAFDYAVNRLEIPSEKFLKAVNEKDVKHWIHLMVNVKMMVAKELNPRLWPLMRRLVLRLLQDNATDEFTFMPAESPALPEVEAIKKSSKNRFKNWSEEREGQQY
jgi:hypothetical protein